MPTATSPTRSAPLACPHPIACDGKAKDARQREMKESRRVGLTHRLNLRSAQPPPVEPPLAGRKNSRAAAPVPICESRRNTWVVVLVFGDRS